MPKSLPVQLFNDNFFLKFVNGSGWGGDEWNWPSSFFAARCLYPNSVWSVPITRGLHQTCLNKFGKYMFAVGMVVKNCKNRQIDRG